MDSVPFNTVTCEERRFESFDGTALFYRAWLPCGPAAPASQALILFHGGHEHSGHFPGLAEAFARPGLAIFAWCAGCHGRSPGERGFANDFMDFVRDAEAFARHIEATYGIPREDFVLLGHSVGAVIVSTWLHDYAPRVRGSVLGSLAFDAKLNWPVALPGLKLWQKLKPKAFAGSSVRPGMLTHDEEEARERSQNSSSSSEISVRVLTSLNRAAARVIDGAETITVPVLVLATGRDSVAQRRALKRFFARLGSARKEMIIGDGFFHEIFHETGPQRPIGSAKVFIDYCLGTPQRFTVAVPAPSNLDTFERLKTPLPFFHPGAMAYGVMRLLMGSLGRLSEGIRLGWRRGFDSGSMLDYVYENKARGLSPLGGAIDRHYLNSPGWVGIRQRGEHLQALLRQTIGTFRKRGQSVQILDVAAGPGRYLLDTLERLDDPGVKALCRDFDETGLREGEAAAARRCLAGVRFARGDAFSPHSLATVEPAPNVIVVSGLYELFDDNDAVLTSLCALHEIAADDAVLIFTNQPSHPQQAFIARTLVNRNGEPWVMRLRSQAEMNGLVRAAGFWPADMLIDDAGIFTVSAAQKI